MQGGQRAPEGHRGAAGAAGAAGGVWRAGGLALALVLAGCGEEPPRGLTPEQIERLLPRIPDREGWAQDIHDSLAALALPRSLDHVCAVAAVIEQESNFRADPPVPGVGKILQAKLDDLAEKNFLVRAALNLRLQQASEPGGPSFRERIATLRTERDVERWYTAFTASSLTDPVLRLLGKSVDDLIRTAGSMQVSVEYARQLADETGQRHGNLREDIYTRKWGVFYGAGHLLRYDAPYADMRYRFADFNAGHFASRNAAFQRVLERLSGQPLDQDGDLLNYGSDTPSGTLTRMLELNTRLNLGLSQRQIRSDFERDKRPGFENTDTWKAVMDHHRERFGRPAPSAQMPQIRLRSDKIQRKLTTEWFANRVNGRFETCRARHRRG